MDKRQTANWKRHFKLRRVRQDNASTTVPNLVKRSWERHEAQMAAIEALLTSPVGRTEGATLQKSEEEKRAIAAALPFANALYLLYLEDEKDDKASEKAHALRRQKTDYKALPAPLTLAETRNVARQAQAMKSALAAEAGLDAADPKELTAANDAFDKLLVAPQAARAAGKTARTTLDAALKALDKFIDSDLLPAAATLKAKNSTLYAALLDATRIDAAPGARSSKDEQPSAPTKPA